jgi:glycosyltransferase involved in cell wall biosynthesis
MIREMSFIIPAKNEATYIGAVIDSIRENMCSNCEYEIILIDNGSIDDTITIAANRGVKTLLYLSITISAVRNQGVLYSSGGILVFLDADVLLTPAWGKEISNVIENLRRFPMTVTGSTCGISEQPGWLERSWFDPALRGKAPNYINSGHLIVSRILFDEVGGFNERLETGEDVDFCERAKSCGARIALNPILSVTHMGFPKTLSAFFRREKWHARGDYSSWKKLKSSKPALTSVFFLLMLAPIVLVSMLIWKLWPLGLYVGLFLVVCLASSLHRFGTKGFRWIKGTAIYSVYFAARAFSFIEMISFKGKLRSSRD